MKNLYFYLLVAVLGVGCGRVDKKNQCKDLLPCLFGSNGGDDHHNEQKSDYDDEKYNTNQNLQELKQLLSDNNLQNQFNDDELISLLASYDNNADEILTHISQLNAESSVDNQQLNGLFKDDKISRLNNNGDKKNTHINNALIELKKLLLKNNLSEQFRDPELECILTTNDNSVDKALVYISQLNAQNNVNSQHFNKSFHNNAGLNNLSKLDSINKKNKVSKVKKPSCDNNNFWKCRLCEYQENCAKIDECEMCGMSNILNNNNQLQHPKLKLNKNTNNNASNNTDTNIVQSIYYNHKESGKSSKLIEQKCERDKKQGFVFPEMDVHNKGLFSTQKLDIIECNPNNPIYLTRDYLSSELFKNHFVVSKTSPDKIIDFCKNIDKHKVSGNPVRGYNIYKVLKAMLDRRIIGIDHLIALRLVSDVTQFQKEYKSLYSYASASDKMEKSAAYSIFAKILNSLNDILYNHYINPLNNVPSLNKPPKKLYSGIKEQIKSIYTGRYYGMLSTTNHENIAKNFTGDNGTVLKVEYENCYPIDMRFISKYGIGESEYLLVNPDITISKLDNVSSDKEKFERNNQLEQKENGHKIQNKSNEVQKRWLCNKCTTTNDSMESTCKTCGFHKNQYGVEIKNQIKKQTSQLSVNPKNSCSICAGIDYNIYGNDICLNNKCKIGAQNITRKNQYLQCKQCLYAFNLPDSDCKACG